MQFEANNIPCIIKMMDNSLNTLLSFNDLIISDSYQ